MRYWLLLLRQLLVVEIRLGGLIAPGASPDCWFPHAMYDASENLEGFTAALPPPPPLNIGASDCLIDGLVFSACGRS